MESVIVALPNNNDVCNIMLNGYPGVILEATYTNNGQLFTLAVSGLKVSSVDVIEWELKI